MPNIEAKKAACRARFLVLILALCAVSDGRAQIAPSAAEVAAYTGVHRAVVDADPRAVSREVASGHSVDARDGHGRTPLMVAAYRGDAHIAGLLIELGADVNALDLQAYDVLTIAAVANDLDMLRLVLSAGADPRLVTSPYEGTALIAAAHLGHVEVVRALIAAGAPLDHINNLHWTALIEAIVLGDGGADHQAVVTDLIAAGADVQISDRDGNTPLALARSYGYRDIEKLLMEAGAR